jgi:hypothetical protein
MQRAFELALRPPRPVILGLRMEGFTLGHVRLLLEHAPSSFNDSVLASEFPLAVFICAQPWRQSARDISKRWFLWLQWVWAFRCRKLNPFEQVSIWKSYLSESMQMPETKTRMGSTRDLGSHWFWRILACVMGTFGLSMDQALDMRCGDALCLWMSHAEVEEKVQLWTDADEELWQYAAEQDRLKFAEERN